MPLLAAYFDASVVSLLLKEDKKDIEFFTFPYVYSESILSNQCSDKEFYKFLIERFLSERKIKLSSCDLIVSGFLEAPDFIDDSKFKVGITDLIQNSTEYIPIVVNSSSIVTNNFISSFSFCNAEDKGSNNRDFGELDYHSNLCVYPQIVSDDLSAQSDLDKDISKKLPLDFKIGDNRKIVFTGGRFTQNICSKELNYVLALDLIKNPGIYEIYMDTKNVFPLVQLLKMYDKDVDIYAGDYIESTGLLVKFKGSIECLLSTKVGEDQFIEIDKDRMFVIPLKLDLPARLSIKSSALGSTDISTLGGEVGIIFDTRTSGESIYSNVKTFNDCIKQFGNSFKQEK
ncbi:hypothetical protein GYA37_03535 [candidate division WWE3 bacterium]|uniref:Uncharacterized protein n=1 Tax=candidate division WWE3 bacterium TaxID=2053526 RepID=A0A7X9E7E5_UNCKA|nr:hypothetical protein [candidate division WWE3 bacterium]